MVGCYLQVWVAQRFSSCLAHSSLLFLLLALMEAKDHVLTCPHGKAHGAKKQRDPSSNKPKDLKLANSHMNV